jgi:hypothetical protein
MASASINIHQAGFRLVGAGQGPWPLDDKAVNIFVFGGSTTAGFGVDDDKTIPGALQSILRERVGGSSASVNVYNFGVGASFSSQEIAYFHNQIRYGHVPDIVVFVDGLNDFYFWDGDPATAKTSRQLYHLLEVQSRRLGRDQGVAWHIVELFNSLPFVKLARQLATATGPPGSDESVPGRQPDAAATAGGAGNPAAGAGAPAQDLYAAKYTDGPEITDPQRIQAVIVRYLANKAMAQGAARELGIESIFAWQPVPLYKYDLAYHPFTIQEGHRRVRYGYPVMARLVASRDMGANFAWCADVQGGADGPLYIDQVHYNEEGNRRVADCVARSILSSGALERARQHMLRRIVAGADQTGGAAMEAVAHRPTRIIAHLFSERAITQDVDLPKPLPESSSIAANGIRLADTSASFASIYEYIALDPATSERGLEVSVRIKPDTSDYFGLVFSCLGGARPESHVIFINPQTMGVISASGLYELVPEPGGWVRVTLGGTCTDPAHDRLQVMLYPEHGEAADHGAIIFGGGEVASIGDAAPAAPPTGTAH